MPTTCINLRMEIGSGIHLLRLRGGTFAMIHILRRLYRSRSQSAVHEARGSFVVGWKSGTPENDKVFGTPSHHTHRRHSCPEIKVHGNKIIILMPINLIYVRVDFHRLVSTGGDV